MKYRIRLSITAILFVCVMVLLCLPTIAFSQKEQARVSALSSLGLSTELDVSSNDFSNIALNAGISAELLYAVIGIDVRTENDAWRYEGFTWRESLSLNFTEDLSALRERLLTAVQFVPSKIVIFVENGKGAQVNTQLFEWLKEGLLPDIISYDCTWTDNKLIFSPQYRESLLCVAWLSDSSTNTQGKDLSQLAHISTELVSKVRHCDALSRSIFLHNLVAQTTQYYIEDITAGQTASDALLYGQAVCAGYSDAYRLLLLLSQIDCQYVIGTVEQDGMPIAHGWNKIKLNNIWYNVDVTWDDPLNPDLPTFTTYFLLSDAMLNQDHFWLQEAWPISPYSLSSITSEPIRF